MLPEVIIYTKLHPGGCTLCLGVYCSLMQKHMGQGQVKASLQAKCQPFTCCERQVHHGTVEMQHVLEPASFCMIKCIAHAVATPFQQWSPVYMARYMHAS